MAQRSKVKVTDETGTYYMEVEQQPISKYVYPWTGVLVNLPTEESGGRQVGKSGNSLIDKFAEFNVSKIKPLWNYYGHTGMAIVEFSKDWQGFEDAKRFELHFEEKGLSKSDWLLRYKRGKGKVNSVHGWIARSEDYERRDGDFRYLARYLRDHCDVYSISDIEMHINRLTNRVTVELDRDRTCKVENLEEFKKKAEESSILLDKAVQLRANQLQKFIEDVQKQQDLSDEQSLKFREENSQLRLEIERKMNELSIRQKHVDEMAAQSVFNDEEIERLKKENEVIRQQLGMASHEQLQSDENMLALMGRHKGETSSLTSRIQQLQKQLDSKQALEMDLHLLIAQMEEEEGKGEHGIEAQKKLADLQAALMEKTEDLEHADALFQALLAKEKLASLELEDARKELIEGLVHTLDCTAGVGIKIQDKPELWNFTEDRPAALSEGVKPFVKHWTRKNKSKKKKSRNIYATC